MRPIGHLSIAYLLAKSVPAVSTPAVLVGGILPDMDFALLPFPFFGKIHRVITHNFVFALAAGLLSAALAKKGRKRAAGLGAALGASAHLLIDADMFIGSERGEACALFYPFDRRQISRFRFKPPRSVKAGWQDPVRDLAKSMRGMQRELPYLAAALAVWAASQYAGSRPKKDSVV